MKRWGGGGEKQPGGERWSGKSIHRSTLSSVNEGGWRRGNAESESRPRLSMPDVERGEAAARFMNTSVRVHM